MTIPETEVTVLTVSEVAALLRCSEPIVRQLIAEYEATDGERDLRAVRLGERLIHVRPEDVDEFLARD